MGDDPEEEEEMEIKVILKLGERKRSLLDRILQRKDIKPFPGSCQAWLVCLRKKDNEWVDTKYYGNPSSYQVEEEKDKITYHYVLNPIEYQYLLVLNNPGVVSEVEVINTNKEIRQLGIKKPMSLLGIKNPTSQVIMKLNGYEPENIERVKWTEINENLLQTIRGYLKSLA